MFLCWASVADVCATLKDHCFNVSCLLCRRHSQVHRWSTANASLMVGQRRKRWPIIKPALAQRIVTQCYTMRCFNVLPMSETYSQRLYNVVSINAQSVGLIRLAC